MIEFIDKTEENSGTPLNRANMMALQGFVSRSIVFSENGSIIETNNSGQTKTTTFGEDGSIVETFVGQKSITKTTRFNKDGSITEVLS